MLAEVLDRPASAGRSRCALESPVWSATAVVATPRSPEFPEVGAQCCGFTLVGELGRGSFGRVYLAEQAALAGRRVALKVSSDISSEASALAQLQHTHIVPVYSIHEDGPWRAVCMPYLGALTFQDVLASLKSRNRVPVHGSELVESWRKRKSTMPHAMASTVPNQKRAVRQPSVLLLRPERPLSSLELLEGVSFVDAASWLVAALAEGLQHAHDRGILHRDLKPANVLIGDDGTPMLVDFNLAEDMKGRSALGAALLGGTLPYMSPEQIDEYHGFDAVVDCRSDVYSLGVVLFELLTGRLPFPSTDGSEWEPASATRQAPPMARCWNPNVSRRLDAVLQKCLAARPDDRYRAASEMQHDLYCCLQDAPLEFADDPGLVETVRRVLDQRKSAVWSVAAATVVAAVVSVAWSASVWRARVAAASTWNELSPQLEQASLRAMCEVVDRGDLRAAEEKALPLLSRYGVMDDDRWCDQPLAARLPAAAQEDLRVRVAGLLLALAEGKRVEATSGAADEKNARLERAIHYNRRAASAWRAGREPAAIRRQAFQLENRPDMAPPKPDAAEARNDADRLLDAELATLNRDFSTAHALLADLLSRKPNLVEARLLEGAAFRAERQIGKAVSAFEACVAMRDGDPFLHRVAAMLNSATHEPAGLQRAARHLTLSFEREKNVETLIEQSKVWQMIGKSDFAAERLQAAADMGAKSVWIFNHSALLSLSMGKVKEAAELESKSKSITPTDYRDWLSRADGHRQAGRLDEAVAAWKSAIAVQPWSLQAIAFLGKAALENPDRAAVALPYLERAVRLFPDCQLPHYQRLIALACVGERESASAALDDYLARYPKDPDLDLAVAYTLSQTSRWEPGDARHAIRFLWGALNKRSITAAKATKDPLLAPLVSLPECQTLLAYFHDRDAAAGLGR